MLNDLEQFYLDQEEPTRSCLLALRDFILGMDEEVKAVWKYKSPFFNYKGKRFCYFWKDKKTKEPYIGIIDGYLIEHPALEKGGRVHVKILRIDPNEDLEIEVIEAVLRKAIEVI